MTDLALRPADDYSLSELADRIGEEIRAARRHRMLVLKHVKHAGDCLIEAKRRILQTNGHGHWCKWLEENFDWDPSTAQYWMSIARNWHYFREKTDCDPQMLTVGAARRLLADARASAKAGLTGVPERQRKPRRHTLVRVADQIGRYNQHQVRGRRQMLLDLREAIDAALKK